MRILLAVLCGLFFVGAVNASDSKERKWSHYDKVTLDMNYLGCYKLSDEYQINLLITEAGYYYHCYLVHLKHHNFCILCEVDYDLASKCFPVLETLKDQYAGPKDTDPPEINRW